MNSDAHVRIRALSRGDVDALGAVFAGMSARSRYLRFHTPMPRLTTPTQRLLTDIDGIRHVAVVAEVAAAGAWRPVGIGRLIATGDGVAEVAFEVVDDLQRHGVGRRLLTALRERACALGHRQVVALVLPENRGAAALLRTVFPEVTVRRNGMVLEFTAAVAACEPAPMAACEPADARADVASRMAVAV